MVKNSPKINQPAPKKTTLSSQNKKLVIGAAILLLFILVSGVMYVRGRKDTTTKPTLASDLAKSNVNKKNTDSSQSKGSQPSTSINPSPSGAADANSNPNTSKTPTPNANVPASSPGAPASSSAPPASVPSVTPFAIESGIFASVDNGYTNIGCNQSAQFTTTASITATAAGTATYHWERSDGGSGSDQQLVFATAGTLEVSTAWTLYSDGTPDTYNVDAWEKVIVTSPNAAMSKASDSGFTLSVMCSI